MWRRWAGIRGEDAFCNCFSHGEPQQVGMAGNSRVPAPYPEWSIFMAGNEAKRVQSFSRLPRRSGYEFDLRAGRIHGRVAQQLQRRGSGHGKSSVGALHSSPPTLSGEQTHSSTARDSAPRRRRRYLLWHRLRRLHESEFARWEYCESRLRLREGFKILMAVFFAPLLWLRFR